MKKMWKKYVTLAVMFLLTVAFWMNGKEVSAAEETKLAAIILDDEQGHIYEVGVVAAESTVYASGYSINFTSTPLYIPMESETADFKITVEQYETDIMMVSCYCNSEISLTTGYKTSLSVSIIGTTAAGNTVNWASYFYINPYYQTLYVDNLVISAGTSGNQRFNPSKNNYMIIRSNMNVSLPGSHTAKVRLRIINSNGNYVYQKTTTGISGTGLYNMTWNGKTSRKIAGMKQGAYVKAGTYKVEVALIYDDGNTTYTTKKTKTFKISKKAPSSTKGVAKSKNIIMYTGDAEIDYMAEKMVKAAGVTSGMSDEKKVKKIYEYMTKKFKHNHSVDSSIKYKLSSSSVKKAVKKLKESTEKKYYASKLVYSHYYISLSNRTETCMQRRCGVCDDHAEIFVILCNHVGVEAGKCSGYYINRSGSYSPHAWSYAVIEGKKYYYDVDIEIQNYSGTINNYWYKKTRKQAEKNHVFY